MVCALHRLIPVLMLARFVQNTQNSKPTANNAQNTTQQEAGSSNVLLERNVLAYLDGSAFEFVDSPVSIFLFGFSVVDFFVDFCWFGGAVGFWFFLLIIDISHKIQQTHTHHTHTHLLAAAAIICTLSVERGAGRMARRH